MNEMAENVLRVPVDPHTIIDLLHELEHKATADTITLSLITKDRYFEPELMRECAFLGWRLTFTDEQSNGVLLTFTRRQRFMTPEPPRWEYRTEDYPCDLNKLGMQGWELVAATKRLRFLKRLIEKP